MPSMARIRRLEQAFRQQHGTTRPVPEKWEDFVSLTTIRSGGKMVRFTPYPYQSLISRLMDTYNNVVVVKSRQLGVTQVISSKFLHRACLSPAYSSMAFLRNQEDASAIARRTRQMLNGIKEYVEPANDSVGYLKLAGLGEIYFKNSSKEGSRSYDSVLDFLFDEAAFCENIEQIYAASSPSGALAGDLITKMIISTPSAKSGWYWGKLSQDNGDIDAEEVCKAVASGELYKDIPGVYWWVDLVGTVKLVIHWRAHPVYSQREDYLKYRQQQDGTDWETILREYDLRFVDSAVSVFSSELVRSNSDGEIEDKRDSNCSYYLGLDTSTTGSDYCVAIILKENWLTNRYSVVNVYRKRQQTSEYHLYQISQLIDLYSPRKIAIEVTGGVGQLYLEQLSKAFTQHEFKAIKTTGDSKPSMISTLQLALEKQAISFPKNTPIIDELLTFRRKGNKLEASSGKHDDCVMALAFALSVTPFGTNKKSIFSGLKLK